MRAARSKGVPHITRAAMSVEEDKSLASYISGIEHRSYKTERSLRYGIIALLPCAERNEVVATQRKGTGHPVCKLAVTCAM